MCDLQQRFTIMALMVATSMLLACAGSTSSNDMGGDTADAGDDVYNCGGPYSKAELDEAWAHFGTASGRGSDEAEAGDWSTFVENWGNLFTEDRSGPRNLDSGLSEISIVFQAAVPKPVVPKYTTSGVRRPREL